MIVIVDVDSSLPLLMYRHVIDHTRNLAIANKSHSASSYSSPPLSL